MFSYLMDKIRDAEFESVPFKHLHIKNFFNDEHFKAIVSSPEIKLDAQTTDDGLFDELFSKGYKIIQFPGCITNKDEYVAWHREKKFLNGRNDVACEGFGVTLRLIDPKSDIIGQLKAFLSGDEFNRALAEKFGLAIEDTRADNGIQKYLDGYEISPHPDIRSKALTYMVNINPHQNSERMDHHTHYMTFKDRYSYVGEFWTGNPDVDRCWMPWTWCDTVAEQRENNSVVVFAPANDTLHAVKASYDHLGAQRTQLYGNLWYTKPSPGMKQVHWSSLDFLNAGNTKDAGRAKTSTLSRVKSIVPPPVKAFIKASLGKNTDSNVASRNI